MAALAAMDIDRHRGMRAARFRRRLVGAAAESAASAAVASAASLRDRIAATAAAGRRTCTNPALARGGQAAPDSIGVLAELLGKLDDRAGFLAAEADRRRLRGLACEDSYEALRNAYDEFVKESRAARAAARAP